ncbi:MAG: hypothetical protein HY783_07755 [Chloroflexi bacterium]|nr:hypothetical protein [Chloroflexota bacterium]
MLLDNRSKVVLGAIVTLVVALSLLACSFGPAPAAPTATPSAAKPTPLPPATTPVPPTLTPAPKLFGDLWTEALNKAKTATKYRMAMSFVIGATEGGQFKEQPFIVMEGIVVDKDSHQTFTGGLLNDLLGGAKIEMIQVGDKSYMKGMQMFGMTDPNKWYIMSDTSQSKPPVEPDDMFNMAGQDLKGSKQVGTETLDGQACQVWAWDMKSIAALTGFLVAPEAKGEFSALDKAEVKSWLCADGYVHQVAMEIAGHDAKNPAEKGSMKIKTRMWDFNNPTLSVKAPEGAVPLPQ